MSTIRELDSVALRRQHGGWVAGTTGAVAQIFGETAALVELVGPDGRTLDMLTVPLDELTLIRRPGSARGRSAGRLAG